MPRVLIVDDDPAQLRLTAEAAERAGFVPVLAHGGREALEILRTDPGIRAVLIDLVMPDLDGMAVMEAMARESLLTPVIVQTTSAEPETIVSAMRAGAVDYCVKPVTPEQLSVSLHNAMRIDSLETLVRTRRNQHQGTLEPADIVASSENMSRVMALVAKAAKSPLAVLIEGENGVGKELVARVIQGLGDRAGKPFVTINCGVIAADQIEIALFGQRKGSVLQPGKFQQAHGGTLFIDEIGELSLPTQAKLLRAIQSGEIEPAGGKAEKVNVRIIAATNRRLLNLAKSGAFREDLYYRLNVLPIYVPPLRERLDDVPALVERFIAALAAEAGRRIIGIRPDALALLQGYNWPGNIRQLENVVYRAIVLSRSTYLEPADFPQILALSAGRQAALAADDMALQPWAPVHIDQALGRAREPENQPAASDRFLDDAGHVASLADLERELILFAIDKHAGRMSRVARALKIGRSTLYRKLKEYGLDDGVESDAA
jgi:DNA-binding NtrC family response regulator